MRAWSPWRHGGPHLVVPQRGCRWSRRKGRWCCCTCFSLWRVGFDGTLLARHGGLQMETRLIRLPALAMCDLRRTRCNRGPIYPRWIMPNEKYKTSWSIEKYKTSWSMQADVIRRSRSDHSVAPEDRSYVLIKHDEVRCSPHRLRPEVTFRFGGLSAARPARS